MLIGITGKAGSGKDQTYQFIEEWANETHHPVTRDAFADRLKWSAARIFFPEIDREGAVEWCNVVKSHYDSVDETEGPPLAQIAVIDDRGTILSISGRTFLQRYGTEAHREVFGQDFWIDAVIDDYDPLVITVVTDARFPNEAEAVKAAGGQMWKITRPGERIAESNHASEQDLPIELIDLVVVNSGSLDDLREMVRSRMERVMV